MSATGYDIGEVASFAPASKTEAGADAVEAYRRDGVVCLREAFEPEWLAVIESAIPAVIERGGINSGSVKGDAGDPGSFFYDFMMWPEVEAFRRFIFESNAPDLYRSLLATDKLVFYYDFLIIKFPLCFNSPTPWHHDIAYYPLEGTQIANCWTALDNIPAETALRFVKASNQTDSIYHPPQFDPKGEHPNPLGRPKVPDIDDLAAKGECEIVSCVLDPGDTLIFNCRTLHAAPGNHLDIRRAALSTNWTGDDVTYNEIPQEVHLVLRVENLVTGGPLECAIFPRVY